jgi:signal transduction histidine kinase
VELPRGVQLRMRDAHLEAILHHLLRNACEAVAETQSAAGRVSLRGIDTAEGLLLQVEDNGPGIPEKVQAHLYEPFVTSKGAHGVGLGLGLTKKLVELYGGTTAVQTRPGVGTTFSVQLPRWRAS